MAPNNDTIEVDAVVVGAGFAGLYALHHLREKGLTVRVFEAGEGVGGTWFWNRYPGARCDVPSIEYSYSFSDELQQEWDWSDVMPAQEEIERYLNHVADRFDLRRDITLGTRVSAASYDADENRWFIDTDQGHRVSATFCVMATGCLSVPITPNIAGRENFEGISLATSTWPDDAPDLTGKRVGVIGTGSSGVQITPELAAIAEHLYVFQRSAAVAWPAPRGPIEPEVAKKAKAEYAEIRQLARESYGGVGRFQGLLGLSAPSPDRILEASTEERLARVDEKGWKAARDWIDVTTDLEANAAGMELYREMIRRTVHDPEVAEALSPGDIPIGCKRPVFCVDYFESFNLPNVSVVDLRKGAIENVTTTGINTEQGHFELDAIIYATGFDAMTGALNRIDISGRDGRRLRDVWADGIGALLGIQVAGFPNLFTITGPGSTSVLANMVLGTEHHVEWIGACIEHMRSGGYTRVEPDELAQQAWVEQVNAVAATTMFTAPNCNSWYLGDNVPGKPRVFLPYAGGLNRYIEHCDAVVAAGYEGFDFS